MAKLKAIAGLGIALAAAPAVAAEYAFVGKWDCGVDTFTFTNRTYKNSSVTLTFNRIDFSGRDFKLTFPDGYMISLFGPNKTSMKWHSLASGDLFDCKRIK